MKAAGRLLHHGLALCAFVSLCRGTPEVSRHPVPREHPRLLGSADDLRTLARQRPQEYQRVVAVARNEKADGYSWMISAALVAAIEGDRALARKVQQRAMQFVNGPIRRGHTAFATDLALCGLAYDLCPEAWSEADQRKLHDYVNQTVDANVQSETHVFHNGWYGYKHWGIGVACYATYHENGRAPAILRTLEEDFRTRAAPALELAGDGGGWAEGYYIHYWLYVAGDATRAYSPHKLEHFTRQIVYLRPNTFVIFDRVKSKQPDFKKTWLLQAMRPPERVGEQLIIANDRGRLYLQTLLPAPAEVQFAAGDDLYRYGGQAYPPRRLTGAAPECRIEISPSRATAEDLFLHVLTAGDETTHSVPLARLHVDGTWIQVTVGDAQLEFQTDRVGGEITLKGSSTRLADGGRSNTGSRP